MPVTITILEGIDRSFALRSRPSTVGLEAWMRSVLGGRPLTGQDVHGVVYDSALLSLMYDVQEVYNAHLADATVHNSADVTNTLNIQPYKDAASQVIDVFHYFAANYAKLIGLTELSRGLPERNDAWSDKANFVAYLWNMTQLLNNFKTAYAGHIADAVAHDAADVVNVITAADVTIPTPNGIVPSLKYVDGWSKALVEIERTEPAFIKGKIGTWLKDIMTLGMDIVIAYRGHIGDAITTVPPGTVHNDVDVVNVFATQPVTRL